MPITRRLLLRFILHVEDNEQVAKLVNDMAVSEEWHVEVCADGYEALDKLTGNDH